MQSQFLDLVFLVTLQIVPLAKFDNSRCCRFGMFNALKSQRTFDDSITVARMPTADGMPAF
jgi:hypothetical protein